jgi:purine-binding chemotaxis protein CheW
MRRKAETSKEADTMQAIGFKIGQEEYGLPIDAIQEIITPTHITRIPRSDPYIKGVINVRGNIIPVIDIAKQLGIGEVPTKAIGKIVIVDMNDETVGLAVEKVSKVTRLSKVAIKPPPPLIAGIRAEYLEGVARLPSRFLIFLNLQKTLNIHLGQEEDQSDVAN